MNKILDYLYNIIELNKIIKRQREEIRILNEVNKNFYRAIEIYRKEIEELKGK